MGTNQSKFALMMLGLLTVMLPLFGYDWLAGLFHTEVPTFNAYQRDKDIFQTLCLVVVGAILYQFVVVETKEKSQEPRTDTHSSDTVEMPLDEMTARTKTEYEKIREDMKLLSLGYHKSACMVSMDPQLKMYRDEINRMYPILFGNTWFDEEAFRQMEIQIAMMLGDVHPPRTAPYEKVTRH